MPFETYPHLESLYKNAGVFDDEELIVTEKVHGTNARVGFVDNEFVVGSRNRKISIENDNQGFAAWIVERDVQSSLTKAIPESDRQKGIIFYGEFYGKGIQKEIKYCDYKSFRVFDIRIGSDFISWDRVVDWCALVGFFTVPLVARMKPDRDKLIELRSGLSAINPAEPREGIVIKPSIPRRDHRDNWIIYKLKSPEFEERASLRHHNVDLDVTKSKSAMAFAKEMVTEQRLNHVLQHLLEAGTPATTIKDTRCVITAVVEDCLREGKELIPEDTDEKLVIKYLSSHAATLFKKQLA